MTLKECIESARLKVAMKMVEMCERFLMNILGICSANLYITELNYMEICLNMQHHVLHLCVLALLCVLGGIHLLYLHDCLYLCTVKKQLFFIQHAELSDSCECRM